ERNHFFRLSAYGPRLLELIGSGALRVEPAIRRNEVVRLVEAGLQDVSISRQRLPWGIPFPGDSDQTVYVWFDALINYLSATGFPDAWYERLWPADLHVIGKGLTRLHCVVWPAMLLAAGLELSRRTGGLWTRTGSRRGRRSGLISPRAPIATSRRRCPGNSRRRAGTLSSTTCSRASPAPSSGWRCWPSRSCPRRQKRCCGCSGLPRRRARYASRPRQTPMSPAARSPSHPSFFPSSAWHRRDAQKPQKAVIWLTSCK